MTWIVTCVYLKYSSKPYLELAVGKTLDENNVNQSGASCSLRLFSIRFFQLKFNSPSALKGHDPWESDRQASEKHGSLMCLAVSCSRMGGNHY